MTMYHYAYLNTVYMLSIYLRLKCRRTLVELIISRTLFSLLHQSVIKRLLNCYCITEFLMKNLDLIIFPYSPKSLP